MFRTIARLIERHRRALLAAFTLLAIACAAAAPRLAFDFTPQQLFQSTSDLADLRERFAERFGREDNLQILIVEADDVYAPEVLTYLRRITIAARAAPHVKRASSLVTAPIARDAGGALSTEPIAGEPSSTEPVRPDQAEALRRLTLGEPLLRGELVSEDSRTALVLSWFDDALQNATDLERAAAALKQAVDSVERPDAVGRLSWGGIPQVRVDVVSSLRRDQMTFIPLTSVIYVLILFAMFRRAAGVILPLATVAIALLATVAMLVLSGHAVNIINNVLPTLILTIGISDSIHMLSRYREERVLGRTQREAIAETVVHTGGACLLTSLTTAVGFISLIVADTSVLQDFGWQAAAGVGFAYIATLVFIPAALHYLPLEPPGGSPGAVIDREERASSWLERLGRALLARPRIAAAAGMALTGLFAALATTVVIDTKLLDVFQPGHPSYETTHALESEFGGFLPVEIAVEHEAEGQMREPGTYARIVAMQRFAQTLPITLSTLSMADYFGAARAAVLGDESERRALPETRAQIDQLAVLLEGDPGESGGLAGFVTRDGRRARLLVRVGDVGARRMLVASERLRAELERLFPADEGYTVFLAGDAYVASRALDGFVRDLVSSLLVAMLIIFAMMTAVFRSVRAGLVSLLPNIAPLVATFGYMGMMGITLNSTTVIIFAISLGIAVDDTIHFLARFREELARTGSADEAIIGAMRGAGRAIVVTSLLLLSGLASLMLSSFKPTVQFGILTGITIFGALFGDLVLLPPLLKLVYGRSVGESHEANRSALLRE